MNELQQIELILKYLSVDLIVIAIVLYLIGMYIKPILPVNNFLPLILMCIGTVLVLVYKVYYLEELTLSIGAIVYSFIQGALASGLAVLAHQSSKQISEYLSNKTKQEDTNSKSDL